MSNMLLAMLLPVFYAYFIGSIPTGLILGKLFGVGDIRKIGSGNIGATNMLRTGKRGLALATLLLDMAKGAVAVLLCAHASEFYTGIPSDDSYMAGIWVVIGHIAPVWLYFKGGKGVATTLGVLLATAPIVGVATMIIWLITFYFTRYSSLSAIISIALAPLIGFFVTDPYFVLMALVLAFMVIYKHKENIERLRKGTETKWSKKNDSA